MTTRLLPQRHCLDVADHPGHTRYHGAVPIDRCPGRHTPSNYRAPRPSPSVPTDPFSGIDEEF